MIDDQKSVEDTSPDSAEVSHPKYEFVFNLPPFLQDCEGFSGIRADLKAKLMQENPSHLDHQQSLLNLEPVCCDECLEWV
jgi:hypothetical protein